MVEKSGERRSEGGTSRGKYNTRDFLGYYTLAPPRSRTLVLSERSDLFDPLEIALIAHWLH